MTPEQTELLQWVVSLPLQAVLLIAVINLWKAYVATQEARVNDLKLNYEKNLADLRTRVMLLEDRIGVPVVMPSSADDSGVFTKNEHRNGDKGYGT